MAKRRVKVRAIHRREVDEDKLALAFLMLAKVLHDRDEAAGEAGGANDSSASSAEAA